MRLLLTGSALAHPVKENLDAIDRILDGLGWKPTLVVVGNQRGGDQLGFAYAQARDIPYKKYINEWNGARGVKTCDEYMMEMIRVSTHVLALWDGNSTYTQAILGAAWKSKKHVEVARISWKVGIHVHWKREQYKVPITNRMALWAIHLATNGLPFQTILEPPSSNFEVRWPDPSKLETPVEVRMIENDARRTRICAMELLQEHQQSRKHRPESTPAAFWTWFQAAYASEVRGFKLETYTPPPQPLPESE